MKGKFICLLCAFVLILITQTGSLSQTISNSTKDKRIFKAGIQSNNILKQYYEDNLEERNRIIYPVKAFAKPNATYDWIKTEAEIFNDEGWGFVEFIQIFENGLLKTKYQSVKNMPYSSPQSLSEYIYDGNNNLIEEDGYIWSSHGERILFNKILYTYNSFNEISTIIQQYEISSGIWQDYYKTTYTYNSSNQIVEILNQENYNNVWQNYYKTIYNYDSDGTNTLEIRFQWDVSSLSWINSWRETMEYNSLKLEIRLVHEDWISSAWVNSSQTIFEYNNQNQLVKESSQNWDSQNSLWQNSWQYIYTNNTDGNITEMLIQDWKNDCWKDYFLIIYTYGNNPFIAQIQPAPGTHLIPGSDFYIGWISYKVDKVNIEFSSDNGNNWNQIAVNIPANNQFLWLVPGEEYENCKIKISDASNASVRGKDEGTFSIYEIFNFLTHNTNTVKLSILNDGYVGADANGYGSGFSFNNKLNALYSGGFILGNSTLGIRGMIASFGIQDMYNNVEMRNFTSNEYFDQISKCGFRDRSYPTPINLDIIQTTYSKLNNDFVFINYNVKNSSGTDYKDMFVGIFADWDIGDAGTNTGGYDTQRNLAYQTGSDSCYYGIVALKGMAGASVTNDGIRDDRNSLFTLMTSTNYTPITSLKDHRTFISSGPFDLSVAKECNAAFALVAAKNLSTLQANSDEAQSIWNSGVVNVDELEETIPDKFCLSQNYPNPFNPETKINYSLPESGFVTLKVYDMLGKEVATLVNEEKQAGNFTATFNSSSISGGLASGIYIYKLQTENFRNVKKLLLLK